MLILLQFQPDSFLFSTFLRPRQFPYPALFAPIPPGTMDQQAATLLATLRRTSAASEAKLTLLNTLKSDIKHHRVPESAQPMIFDCLKYAISQQSSSTIATAGLTTFSHLIKRLKIQDPEGAAIRTHAPKLLPALQERLGDLRESHRAGASQAFSDLWFFCSAEVEQVIRDEAIASSHVRAKDAGMQWVVKVCARPLLLSWNTCTDTLVSLR